MERSDIIRAESCISCQTYEKNLTKINDALVAIKDQKDIANNAINIDDRNRLLTDIECEIVQLEDYIKETKLHESTRIKDSDRREYHHLDSYRGNSDIITSDITRDDIKVKKLNIRYKSTSHIMSAIRCNGYGPSQILHLDTNINRCQWKAIESKYACHIEQLKPIYLKNVNDKRNGRSDYDKDISTKHDVQSTISTLSKSNNEYIYNHGN